MLDRASCYTYNARTIEINAHEYETQFKPSREEHSFAFVSYGTRGGFIYGDKMKRCSGCKTEKDISEFSKNRCMRDGLSHRCKSCEHDRMTCYRSNLPPEYKIWEGMRGRCLVQTSTAYKRYGAKGIGVCERWDSFLNFFSDMGSRPTPQHQIDRIDGRGNYEPSNCRWVTRSENARNKSATKLTPELAAKIRAIYVLGNDTQRQLAKEFNVVQGTIWNALHDESWLRR